MVFIGIVRTDKWFTHYTNEWSKKINEAEKRKWHQKLFITPFLSLFESHGEYQLSQQLEHIGLIPSSINPRPIYEHFRQNAYWDVLAVQFCHLQKKWEAPDIPVYLFPANPNSKEVQLLGGKNGLAMQEAIIILADQGLSIDQLRAIFTHEYHHILRLNQTLVREDSITLLESMIMEGLAEFAVKEEIGEDQIAVWTSMYKKREAVRLFKQWLVPHLNELGRRKHLSYLYGGGIQQVPRWLGYCCGYHIVASAAAHLGIKSTKDLSKVEASELLLASNFLD
ncbi:DUF2268 domain-containing protein [Bacillus sp. FJAT-45037]|uniref:DUF2268 domain-containing protein n=1 Tax=Bacillus sp. FJAT-45037 TaxID=2011007 RepID=UPI000C249FC6|nr:DUF2268 domain-containing putative Zn-dependent protease [Bacillus sp. FJAT-45037]